MRRTLVSVAAAALLVVVGAGCETSSSESGSLGPTTPSGATAIPGGPMEQLPVPAAPKIPTSQQEAQDTVVRYLQQTLDALPTGTSLDGTRYMVGDGTAYCEDDPAGRDAPVHVEDWRDMKVPAGTDVKALVAQVGEIWEGWGWDVLERDGFDKPNRFGYAPDGYVLQVQARPEPTQAPSLIGTSPCFPGNLRQDDVQRPAVLNQSR
ncbi:hypothetical protein MHOL44478_08710 [Mycobacterium holsaticum DSM 44478]|nr:hypothetical protein [Mycolicibacterium holsaticum DSM 44478 = JCM 12374]